MHIQTAADRAPLWRSFCLALLVATAVPAVASAAAANVATVRYGDLDLSDPADAQALLRRLERAADAVCEGAVARQYLGARRAFRRCYGATLADAVARINAPLVTAHHAQRRAMRG